MAQALLIAAAWIFRHDKVAAVCTLGGHMDHQQNSAYSGHSYKIAVEQGRALMALELASKLQTTALNESQAVQQKH